MSDNFDRKNWMDNKLIKSLIRTITHSRTENKYSTFKFNSISVAKDKPVQNRISMVYPI